MKQKTTLCMILTILAFCLLTAAAQGSSFFYASHSLKVFILVCLFVLYAGVLIYCRNSCRPKEDTTIFLMILGGVLFRCGYVLLSGLYERQHDVGVYTGIATDFINPGHLGYIEYLYKFHHLPDFNPYQLFAYFHPPLHHIISCIWLQLNVWLGVSEDLAFENLQILPLLYSCLCLPVTWKILKCLEINGRGLYLSLGFFTFHPATIVMAGSVNNDMLTVLFMCLTIYHTLAWIRCKDLKGLLKLALCISLGMITKLNAAVLALPLAVLFLIHFITIIRSGEKPLFLKWIRNYCIFGAVAAPIGLSWIIRNLVCFGEKPGIPVTGEASSMYTAGYTLWERLGIPSLENWHFEFPFHAINASACHNTWAILFHTALFAEEYPTDLSDPLLALCQIIFVLSVVISITLVILLPAVLLHRKTQKEDRIFLLTSAGTIFLFFVIFAAKYPYTCSSDFRYITICLVYASIALGLGNKYYLPSDFLPNAGRAAKGKAICIQVVNTGVILFLAGITLIYSFWNQW